jgi:DNA-binding NarL/FixJ family response regulator
VARLAAAGRSNREIAESQFITLRAVKWHLGNVYRKLSIGSREELADALAPSPPDASAPAGRGRAGSTLGRGAH